MRAFWLLGAMAVAGLQPAVAADPIKIGFVETFSGLNALYRHTRRRALPSSSRSIISAARCGVGSMSSPFYEDDQQKPDVGKQKTEKLIQSDQRRLHRPGTTGRTSCSPR